MLLARFVLVIICYGMAVLVWFAVRPVISGVDLAYVGICHLVWCYYGVTVRRVFIRMITYNTILFVFSSCVSPFLLFVGR